MLLKLSLATFALVQVSQSPQAVIACARAVEDHNASTEEISSALEAYAACLRSDRLASCSSEFARVAEAQERIEATAAGVRSLCPEDQLVPRG